MRAANLRWNLIANFGGQGWRALMALVFVPFYVRILGVEAYGLIGLYASLQLALALLDAGLRPALAREMARFTGGAMDAAAIRTLLRSIELPLAGVALAIVAIMALAAPWLAQHWVNPEGIPRDAIAQAFAVMGLVAALQLVESAYDSCLAGLQRQVLQNAIVTAAATLRGFGALAVLWLWPTVSAFFLWQAAVALLSLAALILAVYRSLPKGDRPARFSLQSLLDIRSYALGMLGIALVSLLLTQSDRLLLARLMPLSELGRYAIAAALAGAIAFISGPIGGAYFPRLTELIARGESAALAAAFHRASRLMALLAGSVAAMFVLLGDRAMQLWLQRPRPCRRGRAAARRAGAGQPVQRPDRAALSAATGAWADGADAAAQSGDADPVHSRALWAGAGARRLGRGAGLGGAEYRRADRQRPADLPPLPANRAAALVAGRHPAAAGRRLRRRRAGAGGAAPPLRLAGRAGGAGRGRRGDPGLRNSGGPAIAGDGPANLQPRPRRDTVIPPR